MLWLLSSPGLAQREGLKVLVLTYATALYLSRQIRLLLGCDAQNLWLLPLGWGSRP